MRRLWVILLFAVVGCGGKLPSPPTTDEAAEKEDADAIKRAGDAERKARQSAED